MAPSGHPARVGQLVPVTPAFSEVIAYTERRTRDTIRRLPDGAFTAQGEIERDSVEDRDITLCVTVTIDGDALVIDFAGTSGPVAGNVNRPLAVTRSACYFALRVLLPDDVPVNAGAYPRWTCGHRTARSRAARPP